MEFPPVFRPALVATALALTCSPAPAAEDSPLELPKYTVSTERELPPPETWYYARIAGQEVLSSASRRRTAEMARDITELLHALDLTGTTLVPKTKVPPIILITGQSNQFLNLAPHALESGETDPESASLGGPGSPILVINAAAHALDATTPTSAPDDEPGTAEAGIPEIRAANATRHLQIGYFRTVLAQQRPPLPPWFVEGLAQILAWVRITESSVTLGYIENPNERGKIGGIDPEPGHRRLGDVRHESTATRDSLAYDLDFNAALAHSALFSMPELFASDLHTFPGIANTAKLVRWQKQCHAFVHWGLFGDFGRNEKPFLSFMQRLQTEPLTEPLFKECFGMNYAGALDTLRTHIEMTRVKVVGVKVDRGEKLPPAPAVEVREATPLEVARLKSLAYTASGQPGKARDELVLAYRRGERAPALLAELGLAELAAGDTGRARKFLEAAAAGKAVNPRAHVELARLRLAEAQAMPEAGSKLSSAQVARVLEPLRAARSLPPPLPETYELIGDTWTSSATPPPAAHLELLKEGLRLFPHDTRLQARFAALAAAQPPAPVTK